MRGSLHGRTHMIVSRPLNTRWNDPADLAFSPDITLDKGILPCSYFVLSPSQPSPSQPSPVRPIKRTARSQGPSSAQASGPQLPPRPIVTSPMVPSVVPQPVQQQVPRPTDRFETDPVRGIAPRTFCPWERLICLPIHCSRVLRYCFWSLASQGARSQPVRRWGQVQGPLQPTRPATMSRTAPLSAAWLAQVLAHSTDWRASPRLRGMQC